MVFINKYLAAFPECIVWVTRQGSVFMVSVPTLIQTVGNSSADICEVTNLVLTGGKSVILGRESSQLLLADAATPPYNA